HDRPHPVSGHLKACSGLADIRAPGILRRPRRRVVARRLAPPVRADFDPSSRAIALRAGREEEDRQQPQRRPKRARRRIPTLSERSQGPPSHWEQALATYASFGKLFYLALAKTLRASPKTAA